MIDRDSGTTAGALLRDWRRRRRMSQLDLACDANVSTKHLSFLETGRARASREMVLHLAECLDVPLRARNAMLLAAGYPAIFQQRDFLAPAMAMARRDVEVILTAHDPYPAVVIDQQWQILSSNKAVANLVSGADPTLLRPPVNLARLLLHPAGLASRIVNLGPWRGHLTARLRREIDLTGDSALTDLLEEIRDYPSPRGDAAPAADTADAVAMPLQLVTIDGTLSLYCTTTRFGTPCDITLSELAVEAFLPADTQTAEILRENARRLQPKMIGARGPMAGDGAVRPVPVPA